MKKKDKTQKLASLKAIQRPGIPRRKFKGVEIPRTKSVDMIQRFQLTKLPRLGKIVYYGPTFQNEETGNAGRNLNQDIQAGEELVLREDYDEPGVTETMALQDNVRIVTADSIKHTEKVMYKPFSSEDLDKKLVGVKELMGKVKPKEVEHFKTFKVNLKSLNHKENNVSNGPNSIWYSTRES